MAALTQDNMDDIVNENRVIDDGGHQEATTKIIKIVMIIKKLKQIRRIIKIIQKLVHRDHNLLRRMRRLCSSRLNHRFWPNLIKNL